ncbi:SynChlorMet cassette radical SAM/SPASM protein ScmF [Methanofollis aquaemaris]|uniref:SynChlorMet cassette radical SAM/SPASM protein ScmF n=1 Tax=Methanofollis aquaemaris TaxID=126734 RepID=A0A8A3S443_9EURY|nr:SynChlorMet cassette radical SAM/SPASM protein ScmF [Methanofollis aquaemaris]QSZ66683.1 SynChlorMet cassette radical SAM/SPASM protein ScmF [Methanofollis aquaemaris]
MNEPLREEPSSGHRLSQLYFYLTDECNLACRHCWIAPEYLNATTATSFLPFDLFVSIIREAQPLGLTAVKLTGGEPLLHPQFADIVRVVRDEKLRLVIETNGTLMTSEIAEDIAACKGAFVSVSIDGADAATHEWVRGVPGSFEAACAGVRHLADAGLRPQVIMTVMQRNQYQIEAVVRLAESLGAGSVKFNLLQPTARGETMHARGEALGIKELVTLGRWVEDELASRTDIRLIYGHPPAFKPLGQIFGSDGDGCGVCGICWILGVIANGSYALCGIGETVPDLVFGRAGRDRLADVWEQTPVLNEIREKLPQGLTGVCGRCLMKGRCLGRCLAQNYYTNGDLWTPYWFCEEAERAGVFPETRKVEGLEECGCDRPSETTGS